MGTQDEGAGEASAGGGSTAKNDSIYEDRPTSKKIIRVVTVIAYMVSVSFVAIVLSGYYVFLWHPPNPRLLHRAHSRVAPQVEYLVDRPPTEVTLNESLSPDEIRDKVNVFRSQILRSRNANVLFRPQQAPSFGERANNSNVSRVTLTNAEARNNSRTSGAQWSPIVRALLATTASPTTQIALGNSTDVYEGFNGAMKSWTDTDRLRASTVFMEAREINGSSSTTRVFSSSSSSASSALPETADKLYNVSVNYFASTTDASFDAKVTRNRGENPSSETFGSIAESNIKGIASLRTSELLGNLGNETVRLDHLRSSSTVQHTAGTTTEASAVVEKATVPNNDTFGATSYSQIWQNFDKTHTASGPRWDEQPNVWGPTKYSNITGSNITRPLMKPPTNDTEPSEKFQTNFSSQKFIPGEINPDPTREVELVLNSSASIVPAVIQPEPESIGKEQESNEQLIQDGDIAFN